MSAPRSGAFHLASGGAAGLQVPPLGGLGAEVGRINRLHQRLRWS